MSAGWAATIREALSRRAPGWAQVGPLKECEERESISLLAPAVSFQPLFFWHTALTGIRVYSSCDAYMLFYRLFQVSPSLRRPWLFLFTRLRVPSPMRRLARRASVLFTLNKFARRTRAKGAPQGCRDESQLGL